MITTAEEYQKYLWQLQSNNKPVSAILLPSDENIYEINLNTREINAPEYLSIRRDHAAETVYFLVDRFYDNMDLSQATCIIQYKNAAGKEHIFPVPFYDVTTFNNSIVDNFLLTTLEEKDYKVNTYYTKDSQGNYVLSSGAFDKNTTYYLKVTPIYNIKYVKVNLTAKTYSKNSFYYMDYDKESKTFGQYTQAIDDFDQNTNYFAKIDKRFVPIALTSSTYRRDTYYIINSQGNTEIATGSFDAELAYFEFIDSPKLLFPWIISGDVTAQEGTVEFAVRFYISEGKQIEGTSPAEFEYYTIYDLNTKPATSKVLYGMDNLADKETEKFEATALEAIYTRLNQLEGNYNLYWIDADA